MSWPVTKAICFLTLTDQFINYVIILSPVFKLHVYNQK